jgi:hypothetical protein
MSLTSSLTCKPSGLSGQSRVRLSWGVNTQPCVMEVTSRSQYAWLSSVFHEDGFSCKTSSNPHLCSIRLPITMLTKPIMTKTTMRIMYPNLPNSVSIPKENIKQIRSVGKYGITSSQRDFPIEPFSFLNRSIRSMFLTIDSNRTLDKYKSKNEKANWWNGNLLGKNKTHSRNSTIKVKDGARQSIMYLRYFLIVISVPISPNACAFQNLYQHQTMERRLVHQTILQELHCYFFSPLTHPWYELIRQQRVLNQETFRPKHQRLLLKSHRQKLRQISPMPNNQRSFLLCLPKIG